MTQENRCPLQVMFTVRDMKASVAFYRDILGFDMPECWPDADEPLWASMMLAGQSVMLGQAMTPEAVADRCGDEEPTAQWMQSMAAAFQENRPGVGATIYLRVDDVDTYHEQVCGKGLESAYAPKTQFYGIRDFGVQDPDGYRLLFYTEVKLGECQSCGMPLANATPGQMYCEYCTDESGKLKPYEDVFEGTVSGYFMGMKNMPRDEAETAAREHLGKMPAWHCHA